MPDTICARYSLCPIQFASDTNCADTKCADTICADTICSRYNLCRYNLYMNHYLEVRFQIRISRVINTLRYGSGSVPKISRIRIANSFLIFRILKAHLFASKHLSNDALVYCSTCDKSFELQTSLYVHRQAHHKTTE